MKRILLTGPAGAGKTHTLLTEFRKTLSTLSDPLERGSIFVLPSAEHAERILTMMVREGLQGYFHRRITTLTRLVSELFGPGKQGVTTNVSRFLLVREILGSEEWDYFKNVQASSGFAQLIVGFIAELKESLISAEIFREQVHRVKVLEPAFRAKYEALASIYERYEAALKQHGLKDREDLTFENVRAVRDRRQEHGRRFQKLWIDGFYDFSPLQFACLEGLCSLAEEVTVTLTCEADSNRDLFEAVLETRERLLGLGFTEKRLGRRAPSRSTALSVIEQSLFSLRKQDPQDPASVSKPLGFDLKRPGADAPGQQDTSKLDVSTLRPGADAPGQQDTSKLDVSTLRPTALPAAGTDLAIFEAIEIEGETEMIARRIDRMVRAGDYRFSDFAILLREIGEYQQVLRSVFHRYGIPIEIHEREKLTFAPLIHGIVRLLGIFREGWRSADLLAFLKSGYIRRIGELENTPEWVSRLENFALRERIGAGRERWLKPLTPEEETARGLWPGTLERLKTLAAFEDTLRQAADFYALKRIFLDSLKGLFGILEKPEGPGGDVSTLRPGTDAPGQQDTSKLDVSTLRPGTDAPGQQDTSKLDVSTLRRDAASLRRLMALVDEIEISLSGFSPAEGTVEGSLFEVFSDRFLRLVDMDLYSLHGGDRNRVQVYDISLAREKEYRVIFVAGLLEKKFPRELREDPLLSDWERRLFNGQQSASQLDVPTLRERLIRQNMERYLFYLAVTRATETLVLSYTRMDLEGKEYLPSYYVEEVKSLFAEDSVEIQKQELGRPFPRLEEAVTRREMEVAILDGLRPGTYVPGEQSAPKLDVSALRELCRDTQTRSRLQKSFFRVTDRLADPRIHQEDWFRAGTTSASRLEEYGKCSFKYYAHQVLKLVDPEEDGNIFARGLILHQVLDQSFKHWLEYPAFLKNPSKALEWARKAMEIALQDYALVFERSYQFDLEVEGIWDMLKAFLIRELERLRTSPLKPRHFELGFGVPNGQYPGLEIDVGGRKIEIRGKIDRVDVNEEGTAGLVMDYKRTQTFKVKDLVLGVQLQLAIYVMVLERFLGMKPIGGELYSLKKIQKGGFYREDLLALAGKKPGRGLLAFPEADFQALLERSLFFIRKYDEAMHAKIMTVRPRVCDPFCSYASVCRVEKWRLPAVLEEIKSEDNLTAPPFPGKEAVPEEENA